MATPVTRDATVIAKNYGELVYSEGTINSGIVSVLPGTIVQRGASGDVTLVDGSASAAMPSWWVLTEQEGLGLAMDVAYVAGDHARLWKPNRGDQFRAVVAQNAGAGAGYAVGDLFQLGASGVFAPYSQSVSVTATLADGVLVDGDLAISATAEKFKTTATAYYRISGVQYSKAATDNLVFSAAHTINTAGAAGTYWGAFLVQINAAGTVSTKVVSADQVYATEALAIAALPAADAGNVALGYITVNSSEATAWTANTDDLTDGSDCVEANFADSAVASSTSTVSTFCPNPVIVELVIALPLANLQSATTADRVVIFEVL